MRVKYLSKNTKETEKIAKDFLGKIFKSKNEGAIIVGLSGDLGSGKTTFTQSLGRVLGVNECMTSPTFVIMKIYSFNPGETIKPKKLIHIDAYRLDSGKELISLGFEEIKKDPDNLVLIEWPERVKDVLPQDSNLINFKFISENEREISF